MQYARLSIVIVSFSVFDESSSSPTHPSIVPARRFAAFCVGTVARARQPKHNLYVRMLPPPPPSLLPRLGLSSSPLFPGLLKSRHPVIQYPQRSGTSHTLHTIASSAWHVGHRPLLPPRVLTVSSLYYPWSLTVGLSSPVFRSIEVSLSVSVRSIFDLSTLLLECKSIFAPIDSLC